MKRMLQRFILSVFLVCTTGYVKAQNFFTCIDSTRIQSNSTCSSKPFQPVCGCDTTTYYNECFAISEGLLNYTKGICGEFELYFLPNFFYVGSNASIPFTVYSKNATQCNLYIMDVFGYIKINTLISPSNYYFGNLNMPEYTTTYNLGDLHAGIYLVILQSGNTLIIKRLAIVK